MKPNVKRKWLIALRSGEYKQTKQVLKDQFGHCCLGVLCEVVKNEMGLRWTKDAGGNLRFDGIPSQLSCKVRTFCDLTSLDTCALVTMNDNGETFLEIANEIEAKL
jgi:hypothetical protein